MMMVEKGVLAAAAKKPAMPRMMKLCGCGTRSGKSDEHSRPTAPPPQPPLPIVRLVVRILPSATARSSSTVILLVSVNPFCRTP